MRVPWTARRSNQSILKEISPEYSLEGLMLKLQLQYFGHLMQRVDSLEKTLMLGGIGGRPLGLVQWKRASFRVDAGTLLFLSISDTDCRVPAELGQETQGSCCVEEWNSACPLNSIRACYPGPSKKTSHWPPFGVQSWFPSP